MAQLTYPRQVRILKCALLSPGLHLRAQNERDAHILRNFGFDLTPYIQQINLYESIFDNTMSGSLVLLENVGLVEYIPIVGVETIGIVFEVDYGNSTKQFARAFRVIKLHNQTYPRHDYRRYTLELATHEFVNSISTLISRSFQNMTCRDAVEQILTKDLGVTKDRIKTGQNTFGTVDVVIPNYTPLRAINFFSVLAQTIEAPHESNFLFFETLDGFHFTSIKSLIQAGHDVPETSLKTFNVDPGAMTTAPTVADTIAMNAIVRVHQDRSFDVLEDIASGMLRSQVWHFDFLARKIEPAQFKDSRYTESFKETTHLDKFPVYPNNYDLTVSKDVRLFIIPSNVWSSKSAYIKSNGELPEQRLHESVVLRNRQLREIRHLQTLIDLPGQPDLRAGSVVLVNYPTTRLLQKSDSNINMPVESRPTPYYSGKHLVASINHIFTSTGGDALEYRMNLRVVRDSLGAPLIAGGE